MKKLSVCLIAMTLISTASMMGCQSSVAGQSSGKLNFDQGIGYYAYDKGELHFLYPQRSSYVSVMKPSSPKVRFYAYGLDWGASTLPPHMRGMCLGANHIPQGISMTPVQHEYTVAWPAG